MKTKSGNEDSEALEESAMSCLDFVLKVSLQAA